MLKIYGASDCSACKQVVALADTWHVPYEYKLIDRSVEVYQEFVEITSTGRASLPVCVSEDGEVTSGLRDGGAMVRRLSGAFKNES